MIVDDDEKDQVNSSYPASKPRGIFDADQAPQNQSVNQHDVEKLQIDMKKQYPENKLEAILREDGMIHWESQEAITGEDLSQVMKFSGSIGRSLAVNTEGGKIGCDLGADSINEEFLATH